jgi:hypothetical protein
MTRAALLAVIGLTAAGLASTAVCSGGGGGALEPSIPAEVQDVFQSFCVRCHGGSAPPRGLSLMAGKSAAILDRPSFEDPARKIVDTGDPGASYMLSKIRRAEGFAGKPMPPDKPLPAEKLQVLETWILGLRDSRSPI